MSGHGRPFGVARRIVWLVLAATLIGATACGGGAPAQPASENGSSSSHAKAMAFATCMRSHGITKYPDPSGGVAPKETPQQLGVGTSRYQAAAGACQHLLPITSPGSTQAALQQWWSGMRKFAQCMRSHGIPNWPDPTQYPQDPSRPTFILPASMQPTPQIVSTMRECQRLVPQNGVAGHIDNNSWQSVSREMAGP